MLRYHSLFSHPEVELDEIEKDLGKTIVNKYGKSFDIAMNAAGILYPDGVLYVENLINGNSFKACGYSSISSGGIAACHALCSAGLDELNQAFHYICHTDEIPFSEKEVMEEWMNKAGVVSAKITNVLIGGTNKSRKEIQPFIDENPEIRKYAVNEVYKGSEKPTDYCTVVLFNAQFIIKQYNGIDGQIKRKISDEFMMNIQPEFGVKKQ